jgi:hypothetical protein
MPISKVIQSILLGTRRGSDLQPSISVRKFSHARTRELDSGRTAPLPFRKAPVAAIFVEKYALRENLACALHRIGPRDFIRAGKKKNTARDVRRYAR